MSGLFLFLVLITTSLSFQVYLPISCFLLLAFIPSFCIFLFFLLCLSVGSSPPLSPQHTLRQGFGCKRFIREVYSQEVPVRGVVGQGGEENPQRLGY